MRPRVPVDRELGPDRPGLGLRPRVDPERTPGFAITLSSWLSCCARIGLLAGVRTSPVRCAEGLALPLLVPRVLADHHHATVPADDLALVADPLDARLDLHRTSL